MFLKLSVDKALKLLVTISIVYVILQVVVPGLLPLRLRIFVDIFILCLASLLTFLKTRYFLYFLKSKVIDLGKEIFNMIILYFVVVIAFASVYDLMNNFLKGSFWSEKNELELLKAEMNVEKARTEKLLNSLTYLRENIFTGRPAYDPDINMLQIEKENVYDEMIKELEKKIKQTKKSYEEEMRRRSFLHFFYFSAVTITTLGYGDVFPTKYYSKILTIIEVFVGLFLILIYLGIVMKSR